MSVLEQDSRIRTQVQCQIDGLDVEVSKGHQGHDGPDVDPVFRTIPRASDVAFPWTTLRILLGNYHESVRPALDGRPASPTVNSAENGITLFTRASISAASQGRTCISFNHLETNS